MSSDPFPLGAAGVAVPGLRRRPLRVRLARALTPYALIAPATVVILAILAYPLYFLGKLSLQEYGLFQLIAHRGYYVGLHNFGVVLHDSVFWHTLFWTVVFAAVNVGLTIGIGLLLALLLVRLSTVVRIMVTTALVLAWSMPVVVAVQLWYWLTNYQNGVVNYVLTKLHFGNFILHDWYATPFSAYAVVTTLIVWGAIPFVTIAIYAGLAQVPPELLEAAAVDGAGALRRFRDVTFPVITPILLILASLSIIWDFGVFTQPFLLLQSRPDPDYYLMSIYLYEKSIGLHEYGLGSAIALLMLLIMLFLSFFYVRQMVRTGEVR
jgi:N,N'-diacetylchitobiose transport system permease protein